jgi:hypothetical protein
MYNIGGQYEISGRLQIPLFVKSLEYVIANNENFGTRLHLDDEGHVTQSFTPETHFQIQMKDFSQTDSPVETCQLWMDSHFQQPFDLYDSPLYDFAILKISETHYFFLIKMHHLIIDGWGCFVMVQEIRRRYRQLFYGQEEEQVKTFPFSAYLAAEKAYVNSAAFGEDLQYWKKKFEVLPALLRERTRGLAEKVTLLPVSRQQMRVSQRLVAGISRVAEELGVSTLHVWLGILGVYFHRTTQHEEICVGIPVLNRSGQ